MAEFDTSEIIASQEPTFSSVWETIKIPERINTDLIQEALGDAESIINGVIIALNIAKTGLEIAATLLREYADPFAAVLDALIAELISFVDGLYDTGVSVTSVLPSLAKPYSLKEALRLVGDSCTDTYDDNRPIRTVNVLDQFGVISVVANVDTLDALTPILEIYKNIISTKDVERYIDGITAKYKPGDIPPTSKREGVAPNWESAKLIDTFPYLKGLLLVLRDMIFTLKPKDSLQSIVQGLIRIIERRISYLGTLIDTLNAAIEAYLSIVGQPIKMHASFGKGDQNTLASVYYDAANTIPPSFLTPNGFNQVGVGCVITCVAVGPSAPQTLLNIFGVIV